MTMTKQPPKLTERQQKRVEAIKELRKLLRPGDTVYCVLRHVSRSGMSRGIDFYIVKKGEMVWISSRVGHAIDNPQSLNDWRAQKGIRVTGCGMDMGFHTVYNLGRVLFPKGFKVKGRGRNGDTSGHDGDGGYALTSKWM